MSAKIVRLKNVLIVAEGCTNDLSEYYDVAEGVAVILARDLCDLYVGSLEWPLESLSEVPDELANTDLRVTDTGVTVVVYDVIHDRLAVCFSDGEYGYVIDVPARVVRELLSERSD